MRVIQIPCHVLNYRQHPSRPAALNMLSCPPRPLTVTLTLGNLRLFDKLKSPESYIDPTAAGFFFEPFSSINTSHYTSELCDIRSMYTSSITVDPVFANTISSFVAKCWLWA